MENKYYTPSIEEFYVGFEYEAKERFTDGTVKTQEDFDAAKWINEVCDLGIMYIARALNGRNAQNGICGIRVKYLDREDIESLGWQQQSGPFDHIKGEYQLERFEGKCYITADYGNKDLFFGTIKNKSELARIMKMLNINA